MARPTIVDRVLTLARRARSAATSARSARTGAPPTTPPSPGARQGTPADYDGVVHPLYSPRLDGDADPGEIVWTWVPYEEDASRGKDRPVLVVGRDGPWLLGLMLSSKDHVLDAADEARHGRRWIDIGAGAWDARRRPSQVRLDRVLRLDPEAVRREGAIMERAVFERVAAGLRSPRGW